MDISAVSFLLIGIFTKKKAVITKSVITTCTGAGDRTRFAFIFSSEEKINIGSNHLLNWLQQASTGHLH